MYSRNHPYIARIKERGPLTKAGSSKTTYHIVLEIEDAEFGFKVGDSIGVLPTNQESIVDQILLKLGTKGNEIIEDTRGNTSCSFKEFLLYKANISKVSFHKIFPVEKRTSPLIELVQYHQPQPEELCKILSPLLPRFYSIASSSKVYPNEIHLTVAFSETEVDGHLLFGVGSYFLCKQAKIGSTPIPIYLQASNGFSLPEDLNTPIIMIGPGTGIAPFRAFMQERLATQADGRNWLFFGERNRASDFFYEEYWTELEKQGRLRLSTAFSRDQKERFYVQHKMLEEKKALWEWIQEGSLIYVCGDAEKMAKDVDHALHQIAREVGGMNQGEARNFFKMLRLQKRYLLDVYF